MTLKCAQITGAVIIGNQWLGKSRMHCLAIRITWKETFSGSISQKPMKYGTCHGDIYFYYAYWTFPVGTNGSTNFSFAKYAMVPDLISAQLLGPPLVIHATICFFKLCKIFSLPRNLLFLQILRFRLEEPVKLSHLIENPNNLEQSEINDCRRGLHKEA